MSNKKTEKETIPLFHQESSNKTISFGDITADNNPSEKQKVTLSSFDDDETDVSIQIEDPKRKKHIPKDLLGEGGMGRVYSAEEPLLHREVAIKTMKKRTTPRSTYWKRFMREAQITAQLSHPAIVPVYGLDFTDEQQPFLIMKKIEGKTLTEYIKTCKNRPDDDEYFGTKAKIERLIHVCSAISYAHNHGVIHRDLKPDNIMVGAFDEMIVMDWGTARVASEKNDADSDFLLESDVSLQTIHGVLIGTPVYMSPEQAKGESDRVGASSDLYALGMILYELIEMAPARKGRKLSVVLEQAVSRNPLSYSDRTPAVIQSMINKATAYEIEDRYPNVAEFAQDLRLYIRGEPVDAHPENILRRSWRVLSKRPLIPVAAMSILLLCISILIIYSLRNNLDHQTALREKQEITATLIDTASKEARLIDNMLGSVLLRLNGLSKATSLLYGTPTSEACIFSEDISQLPSAQRNPNFGKHDISLAHASCFVAKEHRSKEVKKGIHLGPLLRSDFLSIGYTLKESNDQKDIDSKIKWMYIGTESGVLVNYPGLSFFPDEYDPRKRPWYLSGTKNLKPTCSNPYPDSSGTGYLLPCNQRIETPDGTFIGVAGIDLDLDEVIEVIQEYKGFLLNEDFEIMLQSSDRGEKISSEEAIRENMEKIRTSLDDQLLLSELEKKSLNGVFYNKQKNTTYTYTRLHFAPWTLVLEFNQEAMESFISTKQRSKP